MKVKWKNGSLLPNHIKALQNFTIPKEYISFNDAAPGKYEVNTSFTITIKGTMIVNESTYVMQPIGIDWKIAFAMAMSKVPKELVESVWKGIDAAMDNPHAFSSIVNNFASIAYDHIPSAKVTVLQNKEGSTNWSKDTKIMIEAETISE